MNANLTDITLIVDRSGSMESCRNAMEEGLNAFILKQAKEAGDALLTIVQFDTEYEFVHRGIQIRQAPHYTLVPRGGTALYDAVGRAINETGERLAAMPEAGRPGLVIVAIVTDGEENSSREFTGPQIKAMIERQSSVYNWQFTYLGANQDAFKASAAMGIAAGATLAYDTDSSEATMDALAASASRARAAAAASMPASMAYTPAERAASSKRR